LLIIWAETAMVEYLFKARLMEAIMVYRLPIWIQMSILSISPGELIQANPTIPASIRLSNHAHI
jgi:hypothetical protein